MIFLFIHTLLKQLEMMWGIEAHPSPSVPCGYACSKWTLDSSNYGKWDNVHIMTGWHSHRESHLQVCIFWIHTEFRGCKTVRPIFAVLRLSGTNSATVYTPRSF